jgi:DNA-binding NarL/FixJ family response regulator
MRAYLRTLLNQEPGIYLAGEADTAASALELFFRFRPDVVLVEVCLPDRNGFEVVQCIKQVSPKCGIILLTTSPDPFVDQVGQMLGVTAVCSKSGDLGRIREILRELLPGEPESK